MKKILLSLMMISLVGVAVGAGFADFSDSETSFENVFQTGSLDLKVNDQDDPVLPKVRCECVAPCKSYDFPFTLESHSQCVSGVAYIHIKNLECIEVEGKCTTYVCQGVPMTEPEYVECAGGLVDSVRVEGRGVEASLLSRHTDLEIWWCGDLVWSGKIHEAVSKQIMLGIMDPQDVHKGKLVLHVQQIDDPGWPGPPKFRYHRTNALQKDALLFDIEFDLIQLDPPGA